MEDKTTIQFGCSSCEKKEAGSTLKGRIPVSRIIEKLDACFSKNDMDGAGSLLEYWHKESVALGDAEGELSVVNEELGYFRKVNDKEKGLDAVERSLYLLNILNRENTVSGATILLNAATTLKAFGQAEKAVPIYKKTFEIYDKNLEKDDQRLGGFYNNFALTLVDLKKFEEAETCYNNAIAIMEQTPSGLPDCAVTYVNMAHFWEAKDEDAEEKINSCLQKAEEILESDSIPKDGYYAYVCSKCAPSYDYFGYFIYAKKLNERAKEIYERT